MARDFEMWKTLLPSNEMKSIWVCGGRAYVWGCEAMAPSNGPNWDARVHVPSKVDRMWSKRHLFIAKAQTYSIFFSHVSVQLSHGRYKVNYFSFPKSNIVIRYILFCIFYCCCYCFRFFICPEISKWFSLEHKHKSNARHHHHHHQNVLLLRFDSFNPQSLRSAFGLTFARSVCLILSSFGGHIWSNRSQLSRYLSLGIRLSDML